MKSNAPPADLSARRLAIQSVDSNVVVLAGAGTGKTSLLVDRLCLHILGQGVPVEKIVALTFTKKAAEEMRERLEAMLREVAKDETGALEGLPLSSLLAAILTERFGGDRAHWGRRAQKALEDLPKAQIGTIHGFAAYLLRLYPLQSQVDPRFREDEGGLFDDYFDEVWIRWLSGELGVSFTREDLWTRILGRVSLDEIGELARALASSKVEPSVLRTPVDLAPFATRWEEELNSHVSACPPNPRAKVFCHIIQTMAQIFHRAARRESWDDLDLKGLDAKMTLPKAWRENSFLKEDVTRLLSIAKTLTRVDEAAILDLLNLLTPFLNQLQDRLRQEGVVSFDGLLVLARNLVKNHAPVRRALKKQFSTFLIDEFQDTDPLQGEILFYLAEEVENESITWEAARLAPGRMFVVGDPKQSIYRFRGADIAAFEAFQSSLIQQGAISAELSTNFRSHPSLIEFVNHVTPAVMKPDPGVQSPYAPLNSGLSEDDSTPLEVLRWTPREQKAKLRADESRLYEAALIAEWISRYLGEKSDPPRRLSDVALLFRSTNSFRPYLDALRQEGHAFLAEGEKYFYRTPEVIEFLNLLSALADPHDKLSLVGVLRSPLGALTDREIWELKKAGGLTYQAEAPIFGEKINALYGSLRGLSQRAYHEPVHALIDRLFSETWLMPLTSAALLGEQALANLKKIRSLAEKWNLEAPLSLPGFLRRFRRYREEEKDEGESPLADVNYEAVKVMTIHKAKGLEFPVVILPDLHREARNAKSNGLALKQDWKTGWTGLSLPKARVANGAMAILEQENRKREKAEEVRVFYVALTRVKNRLVLPVQSGSSKGLCADYLRRASAFPAPDVTSFSVGPVRVPVTDTVVREVWRTSKKSKPVLFQSAGMNIEALAEGLLKREVLRQAAIFERMFTSPTALSNEPDKSVPPAEEDGLRRWGDPVVVGLVCHKVLEEWDFSLTRPDTQTVRSAVTLAGRQFELMPGDARSERTLAESQEVLAGFFQSEVYRRLGSVRILGREIPFITPVEPGTGLGAAAMRGSMDVLFEENGVLVVADYKTARPGTLTQKEIGERYVIQSRCYKEAVRKALGRESSFEVIFLREGRAVRLNN